MYNVCTCTCIIMCMYVQCMYMYLYNYVHVCTMCVHVCMCTCVLAVSAVYVYVCSRACTVSSIRLLLSLFHFLLNFSAFSFPPASFLLLLILWAHVRQGTPYFHPSLLPSYLLPQYYNMSCTHNIHVYRCALHVLSLLLCVPPLLSFPLPFLSPPPSSSCPPFFSFSSSFLSPSLSQGQLSLQFQGSSNGLYCVVCSSLAFRSENFSGEIGCFGR